jgi:hypothetical protein
MNGPTEKTKHGKMEITQSGGPGTIEVDGYIVGEIYRVHARRLAACWNACEGISTASLEVVASQPDPAERLRHLIHFALSARVNAELAAAQSREHLRYDVAQPHEPAAPSL